MWTKSLGEMLKLLIAVSVVFTIVSLGIFFLQLSSDTKKVSVSIQTTATSVQQTMTSVQSTVGSLQKTVDTTNATLVDLRRTILIAAGTLNIARDTLRNEQSSIQAANQQTILTLTGVNQLVGSVDNSQKLITDDFSKTLATIQPVMAQTQATLKTTQDVIAATRPMIDNLNGTTAHINSMSASLDTVVANATKPQPWYKKMVSYALLPVKAASWFLK